MSKKVLGQTKIPTPVDCTKLRKLREKKGLTQSALAEILVYSEARICQFETGKGGDIPFIVLENIAEILEVDYRELLIEEENAD